MPEKTTFVEVKAFIKPFKLDDVRKALVAIGVPGMTVIGDDTLTNCVVRGAGLQKGHTELYRGSEYSVDFLQRTVVYVLVPESLGDKVEQAIIEAAGTGKNGDGIVYQTPAYNPRLIRDGRDFEL